MLKNFFLDFHRSVTLMRFLDIGTPHPDDTLKLVIRKLNTLLAFKTCPKSKAIAMEQVETRS
jgi:hypothetical protein